MSKFSELTETKHAIEYLATNLKGGTLVLFLGAGTSRDFGLPDWPSLINGLRLKAGLKKIKTSATAEELQQAADEVEHLIGKSKLISGIEELLYQNVNLNDISVLENGLLLSISALLMGSKRGHVSRVMTLNYDSMLEWFLSVFGFQVESISTLPALEGAEDVRIYHPHGFIPHPKFSKRKSDFVILGLKEVNLRLGKNGDPWFEMIRHFLDTGVCLFIGMSERTFSDRALAPLFASSGEKNKDIRPLGIWILKENITTAKREEFLRSNVIPIIIPQTGEISKFLLSICQKALKEN